MASEKVVKVNDTDPGAKPRQSRQDRAKSYSEKHEEAWLDKQYLDEPCPRCKGEGVEDVDMSDAELVFDSCKLCDGVGRQPRHLVYKYPIDP